MSLIDLMEVAGRRVTNECSNRFNFCRKKNSYWYFSRFETFKFILAKFREDGMMMMIVFFLLLVLLSVKIYVLLKLFDLLKYYSWRCRIAIGGKR